MATGKEIYSIPNNQTADIAVAFAPDGKILAMEDLRGNVRIGDAFTGKILLTLDARMDKINPKDHLTWSLSFSPDSKILISSFRKTVVAWDTSTGQEIRRLEQPHHGKVAFLDDGKTLVVGGGWNSEEYTFSLVDAITGKSKHPFDGHKSFINAIAYSPNGNYLATSEGETSGEFRIWDAKTGKIINHDNSKHEGSYHLVFSPKSDILAVAHSDAHHALGRKNWET